MARWRSVAFWLLCVCVALWVLGKLIGAPAPQTSYNQSESYAGATALPNPTAEGSSQAPSEAGVPVKLVVETASGASQVTHFSGGSRTIDTPSPTFRDGVYKLTADRGDTLTGTVSRGNAQGELTVKLFVDGRLVFDDLVDESNTSANIVVEVT
jgi:hypothetical protein